MSNKESICTAGDVPEGEIRGYDLSDGTRIAVYKVDGELYATADACTHGQSSLSEEGTLNGKIVECAWHFGAFDVTTGAPCAMPCIEPIRIYPVTVNDDKVYVEF